MELNRPHTSNEFSKTIKELKIGKLLRKANITKSCGIPAFELFQFLLLLVFQGKNLYRFLNSKHKELAVSKNTYYRFLNETSYNWHTVLLSLAAKVIASFDTLTRPERVKVFVLDDSVYISRNRSTTLGWSDRYSFVPLAFNLLSSASKSNRYNEISEDIDKRSNGYKFKKESMLHKPEAVVRMVKRVLDAGIQADYVLMDTWFTTEPLIKELLALGMNTIGMVKQLKQRYTYNRKQYTLHGLTRFVKYNAKKYLWLLSCNYQNRYSG